MAVRHVTSTALTPTLPIRSIARPRPSRQARCPCARIFCSSDTSSRAKAASYLAICTPHRHASTYLYRVIIARCHMARPSILPPLWRDTSSMSRAAWRSCCICTAASRCSSSTCASRAACVSRYLAYAATFADVRHTDSSVAVLLCTMRADIIIRCLTLIFVFMCSVCLSAPRTCSSTPDCTVIACVVCCSVMA